MAILVDGPSTERLEAIWAAECKAQAAQLHVHLRIKDAATYVGKSRETFRRWVRTFGVPSERSDRTATFYRPDLDALKCWLSTYGRNLTPAMIESGALVWPSAKGEK